MVEQETSTHSKQPDIVTFPSGALTLKGQLWKPTGDGPFPAILANHGSEQTWVPEDYDGLTSTFLRHGYVFFVPNRRGHNLSADQAPYIVALIDQAEKEHGHEASSKLMVELLAGDHLDDQLAALAYLRTLPFVDPHRCVVMGGSFGGIQALLAAEQPIDICASLDFAGAAMTWKGSEVLQERMLTAARNARCPIYFIQAENDFDTSPSRVLAAEMQRIGKPHRIKIFPPFGETAMDGHRLGRLGVSIWEHDGFDFLAEHVPNK